MPPVRHVSRETRLLVLTLVLSAGVLLALARFRFPETPPSDGAVQAPAPLERLAARATYNDLATIVAQLHERIGASIVSLRVVHTSRDRAQPEARPRLSYRPALRFRDDLAVAFVESDAQVEAIAGTSDGAPEIVARDAPSSLAVVRVPSRPLPLVQVWGDLQNLPTPVYSAAVVATRGGVAVQPVFIARADRLTDLRWRQPLLALAADEGAEPGAFLFSLDGRLEGLVVPMPEGIVLLPSSALMSAVDALAGEAAREEGDLGIVLQPLTPSVAQAVSAEFGAVVASVDPDGPSAAHLRAGDVIQSIDGQTVYTPDAVAVRVARARPGATIDVGVHRFGEHLDATLEVRARPAPARGTALGLTLRTVPTSGARVDDVAPGSAGADAGLRAGDLVVQLGETRAPSAADLERAHKTAAAGSALLLVVERGGERIVLGLEKP
jgi:hypothetical protein